jgi:hypothetical protein
VVGVRWYLELTGFPKTGGGEIHFAHMLWGGLLSIVGAVLPQLFVGRRALLLSAVLTGVGVGLFIDEIGKFITESNDYFFAPAAPLIYGGILLLGLLWLVVRRGRGGSPHDALQAGVEALQAAADGQLSVVARDDVVARIEGTRASLGTKDEALAGRVTATLESPEVEAVLAAPGMIEDGTMRARWERAMPTKRGRRLVIIGLGWTVLSAAAAAILLASHGGALEIPRPEGPIEVPTETEWVWLLAGVTFVVGALSAIAIVLFWRGHERRALDIALTASLVSLVAGGLLTFYIVQFGAILSTLVQLGLLALIVDLRSRSTDDDH